MTIDELNGNEKFHFFSEKLPAASERVGSIKNGDVMLYGSDYLVLFYESFATSYSYTRLGTVDDVSGWANALGSGYRQALLYEALEKNGHIHEKVTISAADCIPLLFYHLINF